MSTACKMPQDEPVAPLHLLQVILLRPHFGKEQIGRAQVTLLPQMEPSGQPQTLVSLGHALPPRPNFALSVSAADASTGSPRSPGEPGEGGTLAKNRTQPLVVRGTHSWLMTVQNWTPNRSLTEPPFNLSVPPLRQTS